jgi:hypothetical protein
MQVFYLSNPPDTLKYLNKNLIKVLETNCYISYAHDNLATDSIHLINLFLIQIVLVSEQPLFDIVL